MKYLDMENAQLEIVINTISKLEAFIKKHINKLETINIKRLIIKTNYKNINEFIKTLNNNIDYEKISYLIMLKTNLKDIPKENIDNFIIVNTSKKIYKHENIYNEIELTKNNIDIITDSLHKNINLIIEPVINIEYVKEFNDTLMDLYDKNIDLEIALGGFLIPLALMKEHPCNAYLCDGWKCGKKISQLPKVIYIDENDNIYPHYITNKKVSLGKLTDNIEDILTNYLNSKEYKKLKEIEKRVFIKYVLNYPYELFPLDKFIEWELKNDK